MDVRNLPMLSTGEAKAVVGRRVLETAVSCGDVISLGQGMVVGADGSAALLHGLDRLGRPSGRVRLTRGGGRYRRLDMDARLHVAGLPTEHVTVAFGVSVTTVARTVIDLGRTVSFRSGVVVADSALRAGCTDAELREVLGFCRRWPGVRRARAIVDFADGRAESPLESVSRVFLRERGLPAPELQVWLGDEADAVGRVDFYWPDHRTVGEADGMVKYTDPQALRREKLRQEALEEAGFVVVRWTWDDIWRDGDRTEVRIRRALARGERRSA